MRSVLISLTVTVVLTGGRGLFAMPEIRDCESEYYDISGESGSVLLQEMRTKNKIKGGYFANTHYNYRNQCKNVTLTCVVRLPRWIEFDTSANITLKNKWEKFYIALVAHEQGHVDIFNTAMKMKNSSSDESSCIATTKKIKAEYNKMNLRQKMYDAETEHGKKNGAFFSSSNFTAIAYSPKANMIGWAKNSDTKDAASKIALENCKAKDCKFTTWANGEKYCVSLAAGAAGAYGSAYGVGRMEAERKSLTSCNKFDENCRILKTVCASENEN